MSQVLFPDTSIVVHTTNAVERSRMIHPGEYVELDDLPSYQQEAALAGKIPGARLMSKEAADLLLEEAARMKEFSEQSNGVNEYPTEAVGSGGFNGPKMVDSEVLDTEIV